jgi:hypothetical protein
MSCSFPFFFFLLLPSLLVVCPSFECKLDIVLLALFRSAAKKNHYLLAIFPKIHAVIGAEIDLALVNTGTNTFGIGEIPRPKRYSAVVTFRAASAFNLSYHARKAL